MYIFPRILLKGKYLKRSFAAAVSFVRLLLLVVVTNPKNAIKPVHQNGRNREIHAQTQQTHFYSENRYRIIYSLGTSILLLKIIIRQPETGKGQSFRNDPD